MNQVACERQIAVLLLGVSPSIVDFFCSRKSIVLISLPSCGSVTERAELVRVLKPNVIICNGECCGLLHSTVGASSTEDRICEVLVDDAGSGVAHETAIAGPQHRLSVRQLDILEMLHAGMTNTEIAHQLGVSARTVKAHFATLFTLFDVSNRTELLGSAVDLGFLTNRQIQARSASGHANDPPAPTIGKAAATTGQAASRPNEGYAARVLQKRSGINPAKLESGHDVAKP